MTELLLVAIFAGATTRTTSTVLEAPPASPTSGGQCTHPYESRLHPPRPAGPGPTSYRWRRDLPSILPAARRDRDRHESCPEARRPRWAIRVVIAILGGVWRPTQVGSDQPDWIRRSGSSPDRRPQH